MFKYIFIIIVLLFTYACSKCDEPDPNEEIEYELGSMNALKNGEIWSAKVLTLIFKERNDSVFIKAGVFNDQGFNREEVVIKKFKIISNNTIMLSSNNENPDYNLSAYYITYLADGDVIEDNYFMSNTESSYIEVFTDGEKNIFGSLNIVFVKEPKEPNHIPTESDTVRFENGVFSSFLHDVYY